MKPVYAVALLAALALPVFADELLRTPVPDARPLMLGALQATDGQAHGVLTGEMADAITRRFGATSPIFIDVTTEKRYAQPGCSRLKTRSGKTAFSCPARRLRAGRRWTSASTTASTAGRHNP